MIENLQQSSQSTLQSGSKELNKTRILFVTIAIGDKYRQEYASLFYRSQKAYCDRYGYDLIVIDRFIDPLESDKTLISLQKTLVCSLKESMDYDYVVFIDADVLINVEYAPGIGSIISDPDRALLADEYSQPSRTMRLEIQRKMGWETSATDYYKLCGLDIETQTVLNSGVMVLNPRKHKEILERIYEIGKERGRNHPRGFHFEQALIGYTFQKNNSVKLLDNKWNALLTLQQILDKGLLFNRKKHFLKFYKRNYFIHFAGGAREGLEDVIMGIGQNHAANL